MVLGSNPEWLLFKSTFIPVKEHLRLLLGERTEYGVFIC